MQGEVEAVALDLFRDAQTDDRLDDREDDEGDDCVIHDDRDDADALVDDLAGVALEEAGGAAVLLDREHAGQERADHAANAVDAEAVERVVIAEHVFEAGRAPVAADAAGDADRHRADRTNEARGRGDGDEAGDGARGDADDGRLAAMRPFDKHPGQGRDRGRNLGDGHRHAGLHARADRRAGVEAEPADPQQARADEGQDHIVAGPCVVALAQHDRGDQTRDARVDVHDRAAGKVENLDPGRVVGRVEDAVGSPEPVGDRGVDEDRPQAHEPQHRRELHAFRISAGDEGRRDDREGHLETHVDGLGDRRRERVRIADAAVVDVAEDALQERAAQSADERGAGGEGHRVGDDRVHHRHDTGNGEARHHGVADVLLAHHAAVEEPETRDRHHQHERHRGQHPCRVAAARRAIRQHGRDCGDGGVLVGFWDRCGGGGAGWRRRRSGFGGRGRCRSGGRGCRRRGGVASPERRFAPASQRAPPSR